MKLRVLDHDIHLHNLRTRMPFKYGIATMTRAPYLFLRVRVEVDGRTWAGISADGLPPKWFTKDPARPVDEEILEMIEVIEHAANAAGGLNGDSAFDVWQQLYQAQDRWAAANHLPPLLGHFGTSLVERALIEAVCRATGEPFHELLRENKLGVRLAEIHPSLKNLRPPDLLPARPLNEIIARHTIGLADPLTDNDIPVGEKLNDGLPQSLAACIQTYGLRHFKIKVNGDLERDVDRLHRIVGIIQQYAPEDFAYTLDGNEQFKSLAGFRKFWEAVTARPKLKSFLRGLIFVEQPLHRDVALQLQLALELADWPEHPPLVIDESDATLESLPAALQLGYAGTTHKNCKGVFKGVANRCLLLHRQRQEPLKKFVMSGEDLGNVGPVALLQDLAVQAALGIQSVERNGHHYYAGLSGFPEGVQSQMLAAHGDLYHRTAAGWPSLTIKDGKLQVASLNQSALGVGFAVEVEQFTPVAQWRPDK